MNSEIFDETAPELLAQGGDARALRAAAATSLARRTPRRSTPDDDNLRRWARLRAVSVTVRST